VSSIRPNRDQFLELLHAPDEWPVVMLNLLKFKDGSTDGASTGLERTIVVACSPRVQELAS
jgi:hypothetical protein